MTGDAETTGDETPEADRERARALVEAAMIYRSVACDEAAAEAEIAARLDRMELAPETRGLLLARLDRPSGSQDLYTEDERAFFRADMQAMTAGAAAARDRRGRRGPHPRVVAARRRAAGDADTPEPE